MPDAAIDSDCWPAEATVFCGYRIRRELGRGAFARVYLADELALGERPVAIKVSMAGRIEAELLAKLRHPNIAQVYSVQIEPVTGFSVVCMPYLGSATLEDVLRGLFADGRQPRRASAILRSVERLNSVFPQIDSSRTGRFLRDHEPYVDAILKIGIQLADALAYTHRQGILHRDLKPSNVLLINDGRPMLLDFNLASRTEAAFERVGGTLPYMPPEQLTVFLASGCRPACDERSDVFSLGAVLYWCLGGALPFGGIAANDSACELAAEVHRRQSLGAIPLREHNRAVGADLSRLIADCLQVQPDRRPQSAAHFADQLRRQLKIQSRLSRWMTGHRGSAAILTGILGAGVGLTAIDVQARRSYPLSEFHDATAACQRNDLQLARVHLDQALTARTDFYDALILRARVYRQLNRPVLAIADYEAAERLEPSPRITAFKADCLSSCRKYDAAVACYLEAINHGLRAAPVFNNFGYSLRMLGRNAESLRWLTASIEQDGSLQPAFLNRALIDLDLALHKPDYAPLAGCEDIERAIALGPPSGELFETAALLFAALAQTRSSATPKARQYLAQAIAQGFPLTAAQKLPLVSSLLNAPGFPTAVHGTSQSHARFNASYLADF
jgi:tetratricopeptide (TPR) repeat protein